MPHILYELGLAPLPGTTVDGRLYVQMTAEERAEFSHRGNALRAFRDKLAEYWKEKEDRRE